MNNGDMPAVPTKFNHREDMDDDIELYMGLTKREQFAAMAMQGIMASKYYGEHASDNVATHTGRENGAAIKAVMIADALLEALEQ